MGLIDELAAPPRKAATFAAWLIGQTPENRKALESAARNPDWSNYALTNLLRRHGAPCSKESVAEWRHRIGYDPAG